MIPESRRYHPRIEATAITPNWCSVGIPLEFSVFPGGEVHAAVADARKLTESKPMAATIKARLRSSNDLMALLLVTDALRRCLRPDTAISLICPYLPYARQDRVCQDGEAFSLSVAASLINSQNYRAVTIWDPHSYTTRSLINNLYVVEAADLISEPAVRDAFLIAPDRGASERVERIARKFSRPMGTCRKERSSSGVSITLPFVHFLESRDSFRPDRPFLVVDDICDGGRTFLTVADALEKHFGVRLNLCLWVTHGIFSEPVDGLLRRYGHIYTANSFLDYSVRAVTEVTA